MIARNLWSILIILLAAFVSTPLEAISVNPQEIPAADAATVKSIAVKKIFTAPDAQTIELPPAAIGSVAYIASKTGRLMAVSLVTGQVKWTFEANARPVGEILATNPTVFIATHKGEVFAIDRLTGKLRWQVATGTQLYCGPGPADPDGCECRGIFRKVSVTTADGETILLDSRSGEKVWKNSGPARINAPASQWENVLMVADCDGTLRAMDIATGKDAWQVDIASPVGGSPVPVAIDGGVKILLTTAEGFLACVDAASRKLEWKAEIAPGSVLEASPLVVNSMAIIGTDESELRAVDIATGKDKWTFQGDEAFGGLVTASTIGIFAADDSGKIHLLDASTGKKRWSYDAGGEVTGLAAIKNGIIFTTTNGQLRICRWEQ